MIYLHEATQIHMHPLADLKYAAQKSKFVSFYDYTPHCTGYLKTRDDNLAF